MNDAQLMLKYLEDQNLQKAKAYFEKVKINGTDDEKFIIAQHLSQYGYIQEAIEMYDFLLRKYPDEGELKILIAELYIEMEEDDEAYHYLNSIKPSDPSYPAALLIEADLYQVQGLYEVSEKKLSEAKELLPNEPVIDYALGELYMTQGRFLEASRCFRLLIEGNEFIEGIDLNDRMAEALSAGGAFEDSLPFYEKALKKKENIDTLFGYGLTAFQAGNNIKAKTAFQRLKEMDPDYHSLYFYLAKSHEREGELEQALEAISSGLAHDEFNKDLHFYAGDLSVKLKNDELAEKHLREALVLDPEYLEAALYLNRLLMQQERYEDVLEMIEGFSKEGIDDPQFHWDAAISYQETEKYDEALKEFNLAYKEFKDHPDFLASYGYFLIEEGQRQVALQIFQRLITMEPSNDEWHLMIERLEEE